MFEMAAAKLWLGYVGATLALSAAATFIIRAAWPDPRWWYFGISGLLIGTVLSSICIKAGWWD
jgi:hypothetical protein